MFDCVSNTPLLPVKKKNYLVLCNLGNCPVFVDIKQTLHYSVALEYR